MNGIKRLSTALALAGAALPLSLPTVQAGSNDLVVEQIGTSHQSSINQIGVDQSASVKQNLAGESNNRSMVYQGPDAGKPTQSKVADFFGKPTNAPMFTFSLQNAGSRTDAGQSGSLAGELNADGTFGDTDTIGLPTGTMTLDQLLELGTAGTNIRGNSASIVQQGSENRSLAVQIGAGNTLRTEQRGDNNTGIHIQRGSGNASELIQDGNNNRNALIATGGADGTGGAFTLRVEGDGVANGLAVRVNGPKTYGGFKVEPNTTGGFNMTPIQ